MTGATGRSLIFSIKIEKAFLGGGSLGHQDFRHHGLRHGVRQVSDREGTNARVPALWPALPDLIPSANRPARDSPVTANHVLWGLMSTPLTMNTVASQRLVAWSPIRSKHREIMMRAKTSVMARREEGRPEKGVGLVLEIPLHQGGHRVSG